MKILFKRKPTEADKARSKNIPNSSTYREGDKPEGPTVRILVTTANGRQEYVTISGFSETEYESDDYWRGR